MSAPSDLLTAPTLHWRCWDDEYVAFNELSGDTHRLDSATAALLQDLAVSPAKESDIAARIAAAWPADDADSVETPAEGLVRTLKRLSLIVPCGQ